jgi:ribosomal protein L40E
MKCRSCGAEIAANALICYKCGTATSEARIKPPARKSGLGRGTITGLILLGLALAAAAREVACGSLL